MRSFLVDVADRFLDRLKVDEVLRLLTLLFRRHDNSTGSTLFQGMGLILLSVLRHLVLVTRAY